MRLAEDLLGGRSDSFRLLPLTKHLKFWCWDLVWVHWLSIQFSHLHNYALEMAPDHESVEGLAGGSFGLTPTSGPDQAHEIHRLGLGVCTFVNC